MKNALTEVIQEVALCGLSCAGFFKDAAFYGGTALRIFYGLDRFSEDLDFSLVAPDADFELKKYFSVLESELHSVGLNFKTDQPHTDFVCLPDSSRCCAKFNLCKRYRNHTLVRFGPILNSHNNALMDRLIRQWRILWICISSSSIITTAYSLHFRIRFPPLFPSPPYRSCDHNSDT